LLIPRFSHGADEGKQIAKEEKVTELVPRVEKKVGTICGAYECAETCNPGSNPVISKALPGPGLETLFLDDGIDFNSLVGYAYRTFAASANDYWGKSWNGPHLLLKKFA
jgi:hypothetical protein